MMKILACGIAAGMVLFSANAAYAAKPASSVTVNIGEATVTAFQDATGEFPLSLFKGADEAEIRALVPTGKLAGTVNVFMVQTGGKTILVDTGNGPRGKNNNGALPALLNKAKVKPEKVDIVLLTHLHGDHVGGLLKGDKALFPKAEVLVGKQELDFWTDPAMLEKFPGREQNVLLVAKFLGAYESRVKTFNFEETVAPGIVALPIIGHTPGHTLFELTSAGRRLFFWGDLTHSSTVQFRNPDIYATYDMDPKAASAVRRKIMEKAAVENVPVAGAHLTFPGIGMVEKNPEGGFVFQLGVK
ncbi:MBL fold metallo-hydrolase [Desulfovibrio sp. OttesenSCG-928-O18]|nr:MBL fold metallo-hydrolase [Desulfovibrio sp. OttesenSCG-928-O18]